MDGQAYFLFDGSDEFFCSIGFAEASHVFDGNEMSPHFLQFFGKSDVVLEGIFVATGVKDVAGVANGGLANGVGFLHRLHGDGKVREVVKRVENAEDVHACFRCVFDEAANDVVGIIGVAHSVGSAEQHLEEDIRDVPAESAQALVGILVEESHRCVECCATPHLHGKESGAAMGHEVGDGKHVEGAHSRSE